MFILWKNPFPDIRENFVPRKGRVMMISIQPIVALVAGILILIQPRLLNYIVAIYLIVIGILGLAVR